MPSVSPDPVLITINWQGVSGVKNIQKAMKDAVLKAVNLAIQDVIRQAFDIVPESAAAPGRYPASYRSEELLNSYTQHLLAERNKLRNVPFGSTFTIQEFWSASYASYVNALPTFGTNWSKSGSQGQFIDTLHAMLIMKINYYLSVEMNRFQQANNLLLNGVGGQIQQHGTFSAPVLGPAAYSTGGT